MKEAAPTWKWVVGVVLSVCGTLLVWTFSSLKADDEKLADAIKAHSTTLFDDRARIAAMEATVRAQEQRLGRIEDGVTTVNSKLDRLIERK